VQLIGGALAVTGAVAAVVGLDRLRRDACPRCGACSTLATTHQAIEDAPGVVPMLRRARRCGGCGATVEDVREATGWSDATGWSRRLLGLLAR